MKVQSSVKRVDEIGDRNIVPHDVIQSRRMCDTRASATTTLRRHTAVRRPAAPGGPNVGERRIEATAVRRTIHTGSVTNEWVSARWCVM
jgi:hypothetical protein